MNDEKKNEICKAIKFGHSDEQIAELEGVSVEQVKEITAEMVREETADGK